MPLIRRLAPALAWALWTWAAPASASGPPAQPAPAPAEILARADGILSPTRFVAEVTMLARQGADGTRTYRFKAYKRSREEVLVVFSYPPVEKGRKILRRGEQLWMYLPSVKRTLKVSSKEQLLGGDFTNGDVTRLDLCADYAASLRPGPPRDGQWSLDLRAHDRSVCYDRILFDLAAPEAMPLRQEYFTASGRCLKELVFSQVTDFGGFRRPARFDMRNRLLRGRGTSLLYESFERPAELPERLFDKDSLGDF